MREAAALLVGVHDYRNFCRVDRSKGSDQNFVRHIYRFEIVPTGPAVYAAAHGSLRTAGTLMKSCAWRAGAMPCSGARTDPDKQMYMAVVVGKAFLWHQIRCMMAVLFAVGEGHEDVSVRAAGKGRQQNGATADLTAGCPRPSREPPQVVSALLDVERTPLKPQYEMAPELPLVLYDCGFEDVRFLGEPEELARLTAHLHAKWLERQLMATLTDELADVVKAMYVPSAAVPAFAAADPTPAARQPKYLRWAEARAYAPPLPVRGKGWIPLLQRAVERPGPPLPPRGDSAKGGPATVEAADMDYADGDE